MTETVPIFFTSESNFAHKLNKRCTCMMIFE